MRRGVAWLSLVAVPAWVGVVVVRGWITIGSPHEAAALAANSVLLVAWVGLLTEMSRTRRCASGVVARWWRRPFVWLAAATVVSPASSTTVTPAVPIVVTESTVALSPALATWSLAQVLQARRASVMSMRRPRRLSDDELHTLAALRSEARKMNAPSNTEVAIEVVPVLPAPVAALVEAAEGAHVVEVPGRRESSTDDWVFLVRILGHPEVVTRDGRRVAFRKGRSLELLVWLSLNRDRMSRSLARTAMWDVDISDATFSTVVSEMRRALNAAAPSMSRDEISHATFSDAIHLHDGVITDVELLSRSLAGFAGDAATAERLADMLSTVRGLPCAGQAYEWADFDGTTTRVVITVIEAATCLGRWALENSRHDLATVALTAGMRVMPGHPELTVLEQQMLAAVRG